MGANHTKIVTKPPSGGMRVKFDMLDSIRNHYCLMIPSSTMGKITHYLDI